MAREMIEPTGALDVIVKENIRPMSEVLMSIMADLLGPRASMETRRLCSVSVVSQVLFYHHCRPVVVRVFPDLKFDADGIAELADHITNFSVAAIKAAAKKSRKS
jgi:hypothetical protein